jgi:hypothetical protein
LRPFDTKRDEESGEKTASATVADFSLHAVGKAVLADTLQHPLTLYPMVLGVLGTAATLLLDFPFTVLAGSVAAMGGGVMSWIVNFFFRGDDFARRYLQGRQEAVALRRMEMLVTLREELMQYRATPGAGKFSEQGIQQLEQIQKRLTALREILAGKVDSGELIHSRYLGVAEQVYLSVLDNLGDMIPILKSAGTIDADHISRRLKELKRLENPSDADREEVETLTKRTALRTQQLQRANVLLTRNEEALTHLDDATAAVANMDTDEAQASIDLEAAIEELQRLAKIAQQMK